jgi:hypothetical protein
MSGNDIPLPARSSVGLAPVPVRTSTGIEVGLERTLQPHEKHHAAMP